MTEMQYNRCLEILELSPNATIEDVRQAYRDIVCVWHPDRFGNNPRLIKKAEERLKEINEAYETLISLMSEGTGSGTWERASKGVGQKGTNTDGGTQACFHDKTRQMETNNPFPSRTEAVAEVGTRLVLMASSHLIRALKRWMETDDQ